MHTESAQLKHHGKRAENPSFGTQGVLIWRQVEGLESEASSRGDAGFEQANLPMSG
jgi:hypothetical protein